MLIVDELVAGSPLAKYLKLMVERTSPNLTDATEQCLAGPRLCVVNESLVISVDDDLHAVRFEAEGRNGKGRFRRRSFHQLRTRQIEILSTAVDRRGVLSQYLTSKTDQQKYGR